jgi:hypothetical protein
MLIDSSDHEAVVVRFDFVGGQSSHEMNGGLHTLVLDLFVFIDEVARIANCSRNTWVGRSLYNS